MNPQRFVNYYVNQTGGGSLQGFVGAPVMYGRGLGSMLSRAFRFVLPFLKQGANIAKPHLKTAAKGVASDLVGALTTRIAKQASQQGQEGSGLLRLAQGKRKRSIRPFSRSVSKKKRKTSSKTSRKDKNLLDGRNIF